MNEEIKSRYSYGFVRGERECVGAKPFKFPKLLDETASPSEIAYARGYLDGYMSAAKETAS